MTSSVTTWTDHFLDMASGKVSTSRPPVGQQSPLPIKDSKPVYFTPFENQMGGLGNCSHSAVKIVSPTQAAIDQAKSEIIHQRQSLPETDIKARNMVSRSVSKAKRKRGRRVKKQGKKPRQNRRKQKNSQKRQKRKKASTRRKKVIKRIMRKATDIFSK